MATEHKYTREQRVEIQDDSGEYPPTAEIVALLPDHCTKHRAPYYGLVHSGDHFALCEECIRPLSPTNRKKLN